MNKNQTYPILIRGARVFAPEDMGVRDVLMAGGRFLALERDLAAALPGLETIEAKGKMLTPGFFDQHVHILGGGGEGGPVTRAPELVLSELIACGTTCVAGVLGTDGLTRSPESLLAKTRALAAEGVSAWMYTSAYRYPPSSISGSVAKDIFMIPECLGVKIALGDHRSTFPTIDQVIQLLADIRLAGMISGKIGVLHIHSGEIPGAFDMYREIVKRGFPIKHIRPMHCARVRHVFDSAVEFGRAGGYVDVTTGGPCCFPEGRAAAIAAFLEAGVDPKLITMTTDGHGSKPRFDADGNMVGLLACGPVDTNLITVRRLVAENGISIPTALAFTTKNVADSHGLKDQGRVEAGACANALLFDENFELTDVFAKGRQMMRSGEIIVKGTFEA